MDELLKRSAEVRQSHSDCYWLATNPLRKLRRRGALAYATKFSHDPEDPIVYYPDIRIAGRVSDIVNVLTKAGATTIPVGELYTETQGVLGMPPETVSVTYGNILANSYHPLDIKS